MSATRNLIDLLLTLMEKGKATSAELAERYSVDGRTIRNYIFVLREAGVPIRSDRGRYSAYHLEDSHALLGFRFTKDQIEILNTAEDFLKVEKGFVFEQEYKDLLKRINETAPILTEPNQLPVNNHIDLDPARVISQEYMTVINEAYKSCRKLEMMYRSGSKQETTSRIIWPFGIHNVDDENYLLAHCEKSQDMREFNIKRIKSLTPLNEYYPKSQRISVKDYFQNSIGAFGGKLFNIRLRIMHPDLFSKKRTLSSYGITGFH